MFFKAQIAKRMLQQIRGHKEFSNIQYQNAFEWQKNDFDAWKGQPTHYQTIVNFHKKIVF